MKKWIYWILSVLVISTIFIVWCDSPDKVHLGDTATITYVATFADGTTFQNSGATFLVWSGQVIPALDEWVLGMKVGKTKTLTVAPVKWFGNLYEQNKVQKISRFLFDKIKIKITNWALVDFWWITWIIKWVEKGTQGDELVLFDINPRETWDNLVYKVTLVSKK